MIQIIKVIILLFFIVLCVNGSTFERIQELESLIQAAQESGDIEAELGYRHKAMHLYKRIENNKAIEMLEIISDNYIKLALEAKSNEEHYTAALYHVKAAVIFIEFGDNYGAGCNYIQAAIEYKKAGYKDDSKKMYFNAGNSFEYLIHEVQEPALKAMYYSITGDAYRGFGVKAITIPFYESAITEYKAAGMNSMAQEIHEKINELRKHKDSTSEFIATKLIRELR